MNFLSHGTSLKVLHHDEGLIAEFIILTPKYHQYMTRFIFFLFLCAFVVNAASAQTIKVMSYNIHHGADKDELNTLELMGKYIKRSGADIIGLQEVDSMCNRSGKVDQMKRLAEITGMHYAFVRHFAYDGGAYGLGILSKFPISDVKNNRVTILPQDPKKPSLAFLTAEIMLPGKRPLLFGTAHFSLNTASRLVQSDEVLAVMKKDLPAILTGDLNANPGTDEVGKLEGFFKETGRNQDFTFPTGKAVKKIDYIMVSKKDLKKVIRSVVHDDIHLSDHLPMVSTFRLQ